ncbi:hypothetical protein JB92DRAFT_3100207 [Gautieria morchelliformis]|nr:hypothetical protein JB92DRAFT_3100207 [Gautieria morchelliformis]
MENGHSGLGMTKTAHRLREYRPPTLGLEPGGGIELGTVRVYELAGYNIVAGSLVNAAHGGDGEEERRSRSSGEGFSVGAAAATVAGRNPLTTEVDQSIGTVRVPAMGSQVLVLQRSGDLVVVSTSPPGPLFKITRVGLATAASRRVSLPVTAAWPPQRLWIQLGIHAETVEYNKRCRAIIATTDDISITNEEHQLAFIIISESSQRINRAAD